ncbi:hypothetical protein [Vibrio mimicus]|uniref:hypothetical protein n=1 Tax=Vibrio mimicus TaxID=674 RepID=UPI0001BADFA2|nr:hypothetical protein [Vibrio mimicus]EEY39960.1 hypothetical protein VII_003731 [Vibrio mimicus MB451]EGU17942.1 hypothetical protein SX4_1351 [Vibrio mimicus SX-4]ERM63231.1 hypothetical protein P781_00695 [Vibrio mimicus CAIM 1883]ERM63425.1 hypothetical protein P780_00680 [Vibrio mimicus CAIM 1882]
MSASYAKYAAILANGVFCQAICEQKEKSGNYQVEFFGLSHTLSAVELLTIGY